MADETKVERAGIPVMPLVASVVTAVVVAVAGVGGAGYWLVKSGRLPVVQGAARTEPATVVAPIVKTKLVALAPLLVNLADVDGRSYLRVAMTLRVVEPQPGKGEKPKEPEKGKPVNEDEAAMRDAALDVLGRQTGASLLAPDGKEMLKAELLGALKTHVPGVKVDEVLFTEFLVQR